MRLPSAVGLKPAVVTSHPSRVASSISFPISVISRSLGLWPLFSSIRTIERNRIACLLGWLCLPDLVERGRADSTTPSSIFSRAATGGLQRRDVDLLHL